MDKLSAVALHGFVYSNNFGDMLLANIAQVILHRHAPETEVTLPFATDVFLRDAGIAAATGWRSFMRSDALLYHGGGYFAFGSTFHWRTRPRLFHRFYTPALAAAAAGKPYGIFGVGVGPLHSPVQRYAVRKVFEAAGSVTVRDEESYDWLCRIGVRHDRVLPAADLALTLTHHDVPAEAAAAADQILLRVPAERHIGLHLSAPSDVNAAYDGIMRGVIKFVTSHPEIGFVIFCDHVAGQNGTQTPQYRAAQELAARIGARAILVGQPDMWTLVALLAKLDGLVTNKLHTGIVSSAFGRRVVSIAKNDKNFRFFRQLGAPERCVSVAQSQDIDIPDLLEQGFQSLHVPTSLPGTLRDLAARNEMQIRAFLNSLTAKTPYALGNVSKRTE